MLREMNMTKIVLTPKCLPVGIHQFRSINLSNFIYKIISKTIVNILKPWMSSLIPENQNAFVPHQAIQDNIMIVHEVFHYLKMSNNKLHSMA